MNPITTATTRADPDQPGNQGSERAVQFDFEKDGRARAVQIATGDGPAETDRVGDDT